MNQTENNQTITQLQIDGNLQRNLFSFQQYKSIQTIIINTNKIVKGMFSKMNIQKVIIKENVQEIEERSFQQCEESTQIEFDEDSQVKYIGDFAFKNCKKLNEITLPNSLETINFQKVFSGTSLTSIQMSENNQKNDKFEIINNNVYLINEDERK